MFKKWNFWLSIISTMVAIIADSRQIGRLDNKQHLFDMHIKSYLIAKGMLQLFVIKIEIF